MGADSKDTAGPVTPLPDDDLSSDPSAWRRDEYAQVWASGAGLDPDLPLYPIQDLLFAVGMVRRCGDPTDLQEERSELDQTLSELLHWGMRRETRQDALEGFDALRGFAEQARHHVRVWGCELRDGEVKIMPDGRGRPVELFTVAVGLLWERETRHYTDYAPEDLCRSILPLLRVFWPEKSMDNVQSAATRFRKNRETYDRAFGRLTPPGHDMSW